MHFVYDQQFEKLNFAGQKHQQDFQNYQGMAKHAQFLINFRIGCFLFTKNVLHLTNSQFYC